MFKETVCGKEHCFVTVVFIYHDFPIATCRIQCVKSQVICQVIGIFFDQRQ